MEYIFSGQTVSLFFDRRLRWMLGIGIAAVVVAGVAASAWWRGVQTDRLIAYVPSDAAVYVHARRPIFSGELRLTDMVRRVPQLQAALGLSDRQALHDLLGDADEAAVFAVPVEEKKLAWALLVKTRKPGRDDSTIQSQLLNLRERLVLLSATNAVREAVGAVNDGGRLSLRTQFTEVPLTRQQIFFTFTPREATVSGASALYTNVAQTLPQRITAGVAVGSSSAALEFVPAFRLPRVGSSLSVTTIPPDAVLAMAGLSLDELMYTLGTAEVEWKDFFNSTLQRYTAFFDKPSSALHAFAQSPAQLVLRGDGATASTSVTVVLPAVPTTALKEFEQFFSVLLSQALPEHRVRTLPDDSSITELVADPAAVRWTTEKTARGETVHVGSMREGQPVIVFAQTDDQFFASTDKTQLHELVMGGREESRHSPTQCEGASPRSVWLLLNISSLTSGWFGGEELKGQQRLLIGTQSGGASVGCLVF